MNKRTLLAASFAAITFAGTASANDYITGQVGDYWSYNGTGDSGLPRAEIIGTSGSWRHFDNFAHLGDMWVWSSSSHNTIYVYTSATGTKLFADLDADQGTTQSISESICSEGQTEIDARNPNLVLPIDAPNMTKGVTVTCNGRSIVFGENMGVIKTHETVGGWVGVITTSVNEAQIDGVQYGEVVQPPVENQAPDANADSASTAYETAVNIDVLANDSDSDGSLNASTVTVTLDAQHGTTSVNSDGSITYTPNASYSGADDFAYSVQDNEGATSDSVLVSVTVANAPTQGGGNQALEATASATSTYSSYSASNTNDGSSNTNWYSDYVYSYGSVEVELNWNNTRSLDFLEIEWVSNYFPYDYDVYYKDQNGYWTLLEDNVSYSDAANLNVTTDGIKVVMQNDRINYNSGYMGIYEITVE